MLAPSPAPDCTITLKPSFASFATTSGTVATRFSSGKVSLGIPMTCGMKLPWAARQILTAVQHALVADRRHRCRGHATASPAPFAHTFSMLAQNHFLAGGGEMGERMRSLDWSSTALGPIDRWPQSLRSPLSMLLPSKAQIILFWGPEFVVFYNDAYRPVFGAKHPHALGLPGREAWSEIWDSQLHELLAGVVRTGEAFHGQDLPFLIERHGYPEETYFDVSYDPVRDESG